MQPIIWMLTFSVLGPNPPAGGEIAKFKSKEECLVALEQKRQEFAEKKLKITGTCVVTTKQPGK